MRRLRAPRRETFNDAKDADDENVSTGGVRTSGVVFPKVDSINFDGFPPP
jgi:hypothetical protein